MFNIVLKIQWTIAKKFGWDYKHCKLYPDNDSCVTAINGDLNDEEMLKAYKECQAAFDPEVENGYCEHINPTQSGRR